jgi:hypothetical protein
MAEVIELIRDVAQKIRPCPRETITNAYVRAVRQFCGESRWYRVTLDAVTVADQAAYSLGSDPLLEVIDVPLASIVTNPAAAANSYNRVPLRTRATEVFDPNVEPSRPIHFAYLPEGQVVFHPTPDAAYPVSLTLAVQPRDGVSEIPGELLAKWRLAFEDGALAYLYGLTGEPWADPNLAMMHRSMFRAAISNGKANVAMSFQSGSQRATPRPFVTR